MVIAAGHNAVQAVLGFVVAGVSAGWIKAANAPVPETWWEAGPYVLFIGALVYAVLHLWKELRETVRDRERRDETTIERQRQTNERLADTLDRLGEKIDQSARRVQEGSQEGKDKK